MKHPFKKYACPAPGCGKEFSTSSHLSRHKTSHLEISRYKCHKCEKAFKRSDILNRHILKLHGGKNDLSSGGVQKPLSVNGSDVSITAKSKNNSLSISNLISNDKNSNQDLERYPSKSELTPSFNSLVSKLSENNEADSSTHNLSPLSNSDVYSWISGIAPLDSESALASSIFDHNDMGWLFNELDGESKDLKPEMLGLKINAPIPSLKGHVPLKPERRIQFSPLPDFLNTLVDSNLQTPTNLIALQEHLKTGLDNEKDTAEDDVWKSIEKKIKEVLFDHYDGVTSGSPKLTLSNAYAEKLVDNKFFEARTIKRLFHLYFEVFHDHFPILHKPSFLQNPQKVAPLLIVSMITLGSYYDSEENYATAVELHQRLRWLIFSSQDLIPPKLWAIQTLALIQAFEKMASTRHQHEVSATFHSAVITLLRRDGSCANMRTTRYHIENPNETPSPDDEYALWIEKESIKRCVLFLFMMDAQHSLLFGHTSFMSATEIRLDLPCSEDLWNANNVYEWSKKISDNVNSEMPNTECSFLDTLRSLLSEKLLPLHISPFAKFCVLHGLLSVIWHVQQSDPGSLGVNNPSKSIQSRREILERAIETWSFSIMSRAPSLATDGARVMHRLAFITLYTSQTSILDILTFCGSSSLIGRPLRTADFLKAKVSVENWVNSEDASQGFIHSLLLIHQIVFSGNAFDGIAEKYKASTDKIALRPWCLYMATLVVWVYSFFKLKNSGVRLVLPNPRNIDIHTAFLKAEEFVLTSLRPNMKAVNMGKEKNLDDFQNTVYLLAIVRESLKECRWEMMSDAYNCLGKLIGVDKDNLENNNIK